MIRCSSFPPNPTQAEQLRKQLPVFANVSNPLDYHNHIWGNREAQSRVMHTLTREGYDLAVLVIDYPNDAFEPTEWDVAIDALLDVHARVDVPMVVRGPPRASQTEAVEGPHHPTTGSRGRAARDRLGLGPTLADAGVECSRGSIRASGAREEHVRARASG